MRPLRVMLLCANKRSLREKQELFYHSWLQHTKNTQLDVRNNVKFTLVEDVLSAQNLIRAASSSREPFDCILIIIERIQDRKDLLTPFAAVEFFNQNLLEWVTSADTELVRTTLDMKIGGSRSIIRVNDLTITQYQHMKVIEMREQIAESGLLRNRYLARVETQEGEALAFQVYAKLEPSSVADLKQEAAELHTQTARPASETKLEPVFQRDMGDFANRKINPSRFGFASAHSVRKPTVVTPLMRQTSRDDKPREAKTVNVVIKGPDRTTSVRTVIVGSASQTKIKHLLGRPSMKEKPETPPDAESPGYCR